MSKLSEAELFRLEQEELRLLKEQYRITQGLPHLYSMKFYPWGRVAYESSNREIFLCSANQVGKSTVAIRKNIWLATEPSVWKRFWPKLLSVHKPNLFWYFYPNFQLATTEFETKWEPLLPQGEFKKHPQYGWQAVYDKGVIQKIHFNSGVTIQFRAYSQKLIDIQAASVYHVTADEEMPVHLLPEISARMNSTDGLLFMVFTATLGQIYWKETMEPSTQESERHKGALKIQVSLYDSMEFEDGTPSHWTNEKIERAKANCPTDAEVQRRVYGRFVKSQGLVYESFSVEKNRSKNHPLPKDWHVYSAVDPGTGGESGHPAGILFVGVNPQYTKGRVFRGWRGDGVSTDSQAILNKHRELRKGLTRAMDLYDWAAKDFFLVATSQGENFVAADKARESGIAIVNTLFKNDMLAIQEGDPELEKLVTELCTLAIGMDKRKAKDDLIDPLRYICKMIPWDFSQIELPESLREEAVQVAPKDDRERRRDYYAGRGEYERPPTDAIEGELDYWGDMHGD